MSSNAIVAISAAALATGLIAGLPPIPGFAPEAKAASISQFLAKGDRLTTFVGGTTCSSRSWPNYDQACQFDLRRSVDTIRKVRVLDLERETSAFASLQIVAPR